MKLKDLNIEEFLNQTASNTPVPGGGSISALNGAVATSLCEMLANLTIGKKRYVEVEEKMKAIAQDMNNERKLLLEDIDRDAEAYNLVMNAFKLPKDTDEQKEYRRQQIQESSKLASLAPLAIAQRAFDMMDTIAMTVKSGNANAITDGCISMMTCRTAVLGAILNVRINLGGIDDAEFVEQMNEKCDSMETEAIKKEQEVVEWVGAFMQNNK